MQQHHNTDRPTKADSASRQAWQEMCHTCPPLYVLLPNRLSKYIYALSSHQADYLQYDLIGVPRKHVADIHNITTASLSNSLALTRKKLGLSMSEYKKLKITIMTEQLQSHEVFAARVSAFVFSAPPKIVAQISGVAVSDLAVHVRKHIAALPEKERKVLELYLVSTPQQEVITSLSLHRSDAPRLLSKAKEHLLGLISESQKLKSPLSRRTSVDWLAITNHDQREVFQRYMEGWSKVQINWLRSDPISPRSFSNIIERCSLLLGLSRKYVLRKHLTQKVRRVESLPLYHSLFLRRAIGKDLLRRGYNDNHTLFTESLAQVRTNYHSKRTIFMLRLRVAGLTYHQIAVLTRRSPATCRDDVHNLVLRIRAHLKSQMESDQ